MPLGCKCSLLYLYVKLSIYPYMYNHLEFFHDLQFHICLLICYCFYQDVFKLLLGVVSLMLDIYNFSMMHFSKNSPSLLFFL